MHRMIMQFFGGNCSSYNNYFRIQGFEFKVVYVTIQAQYFYWLDLGSL